MNRIVVANDFSTCSENAVKYAQLLGGESNQFLKPFFAQNTYKPLNEVEVVVKNLNNLEDFDTNVSKKINYQYLLVLGQELLMKLHKKTLHSIKEPMLIVPSEHQFQKVDNVLFLCFSSDIDKVMQKVDLPYFSENFEGQTSIMNISKTPENNEVKPLNFVLDYKTNTKNKKLLFFNDTFLLDQLHQYIQNTKVNLVILLLNPVQTKQMNTQKIVENIKIPFLTSFILD